MKKDYLKEFVDNIELSTPETKEAFEMLMELIEASPEKRMLEYLDYQIDKGHMRYLIEKADKEQLEALNERYDSVYITGQKSRIKIYDPVYFYQRALCKFQLALITENESRRNELMAASIMMVEMALNTYPDNLLLLWLQEQIRRA